MKPVNTRARCPVSRGLETVKTVGWVGVESKTCGAATYELLLDLQVLATLTFSILTTFPTLPFVSVVHSSAFHTGLQQILFKGALLRFRSVYAPWIINL